jgi:hypothetical protein
MSSLSTIQEKLQQKPNSRERIIFFVALAAFAFGFYKAFIVESNNAVSTLQEQLDKVIAEQDQLKAISAVPMAQGKQPADPKLAHVKWVGDKRSVGFASDALIRAARDSGIILLKVGLPEFKDKQNFLYKPVSLTLTGSLGDLGRYIENSEQLEVPLVIENLSLEHSNEFEDLLTLRIEGGFYAEK